MKSETKLDSFRKSLKAVEESIKSLSDNIVILETNRRQLAYSKPETANKYEDLIANLKTIQSLMNNKCLVDFKN